MNKVKNCQSFNKAKSFLSELWTYNDIYDINNLKKYLQKSCILIIKVTSMTFNDLKGKVLFN